MSAKSHSDIDNNEITDNEANENSTSDNETEKEYKKRVDEGKAILSKSTKKPRREAIDLSADQMRVVAELLRENDHVYNKESPQYRDARARNKAHRSIADAIGVSCKFNEFQILAKMNRIYKFISHK